MSISKFEPIALAHCMAANATVSQDSLRTRITERYTLKTVVAELSFILYTKAGGGGTFLKMHHSEPHYLWLFGQFLHSPCTSSRGVLINEPNILAAD